VATVTVATVAERLAANLLADDAATAKTSTRPCAVCRRRIGRGDRYARLVPSGKLAHLPCVAAAAKQQPSDLRRDQ